MSVSHRIAFVFAIALSLLVLGSAQKLNNRPIIGILTQPTSGKLSTFGSSYIAASYVKYVEMAGGRVVPVFHNSTQAELRKIFQSINGLLFPGGGSSLDRTPLYYAGLYLYNLALEANAKGDYFPIFGHCLGFELLCMITSGDNHILSPFDAEDISMHLDFTPEYQQSRLFGNAPKEIIDIFANPNNPVTMNNHMWGVSPEDFSRNANLTNFYRVLSYNLDRQNKKFISTIEGKSVPIYGLQWHPEKNNFEWHPKAGINHTPEGILATQYMANFFVNEARKNFHSFPSYEEESRALIYNYSPVYTAPFDSSFVQCYVF